MGKYEEVLEEGAGPKVPRSKGSKVKGFQGPGVPKSQGPKDQDISNSHSNTSLTLKKVHLVLSSDDNQYLIYLNFIAGPNFIPMLVKWVSVSKTKVLPSIFSLAKDSA